MKAPPSSRPCELQLLLEPGLSEVLRAFVREAALADDAPPPLATMIADDAVEVWLALGAKASGREHAHVSLASARGELCAKIRLQGHSRFSSTIASLAGRLRHGGGVSHRERGVDGWEVSIHRSASDAAAFPETPDVEPSAEIAASDADLFIDLAKQADSAGIARCFLEVYGRAYVHREVYSPRRYWEKVENGELIPAVTRNARGEVVGHVALEREPGAAIAERGEAVVLPAYRGHHLLERMTARLSQEAPGLGLVGVYAMPVTLHTFSQRNDERAGMPVCAIVLGCAPEDCRPKDLAAPTAGQRQSLLITFRFLQPPAPRAIHAPAPYREIIGKIYGWLGVATQAAEPAAVAGDSSAGVKVDDRSYGAIRFERIGANAAIELKQALQDVTGLGARCVQLSAPVTDPGLPLLTEAARRLGFFFCGVGPCFDEGADVLLLQLLLEPLDTGKLQLFAEETKELLSFIDGDRAAVDPAA